MGNKQNSVKRSKFRLRKIRRLILQNVAQRRRQKKILRKLNPPPKPEPEDEPESKVEVEPEVTKAPSLSQSVEVTGPRSCRLRKCAFSGCPNSAPSPAQHNDGITFFPFPRKPGQDSMWARSVSRANGEQFWPRLTSRVCHLHFPPELITTDHRGAAVLARGAVPDAEPYKKGEIPNIEEALLQDGDINEQCGSLNSSQDLVINLDSDDENPELKQADASLVNIPPPEDGIKLQCVNVENKNAAVHYFSVDKDNTVNHTHMNTNENNIATLHYVDSKNTGNPTLNCNNLKGDQISSYEVTPNITQTRVMRTEIGPNQNDQENDFGIKINSELVGGKNMTPDKEIDETIQNTESDNLDTDIRVESEDCNSDAETEETIIGEAGTSTGIQMCDVDLDETVVVNMENEPDRDNGMEPET